MKYLISPLLCLFATSVQAVTTFVPAGTGTLEAAITAAASGDTLVLEGTYVLAGDAIVDKGLIIRADRRTPLPIVRSDSSADSIIIQTPEPVTFQGISFQDNAGSGTALLTDNVPSNGVSEVNLVDNTFEGFSISFNDIGVLHIVANHFLPRGLDVPQLNVFSPPVVNGFRRALVAGNIFTSTAADAADVPIAATLNYGTIRGGSFIGNYILCSTESTGTSVCFTLDGADAIGNEFFTAVNRENIDVTHFRVFGNPSSGNAAPIIANNLFRFAPSGGLDNETADGMIAVEVVSSGAQGLLTLRNNVVDYTAFNTGAVANLDAAAFSLKDEALIEGNIINRGSDADHPALFFQTPSIQANSIVRFNTCYLNATDCGTDNGNLIGDPNFGGGNFLPNAGSPAIDAGPPATRLFDLDLTRNDQGIHGGPLPFQQLSDQIDQQINGSTAAIGYPIFVRNQGQAAGGVGVEFVGISRLK